MQGSRADAQVRDRFTTLRAMVLLPDIRSHQPQNAQEARATGIHADRMQQQLGTRHDAGRHQEKCSG